VDALRFSKAGHLTVRAKSVRHSSLSPRGAALDLGGRIAIDGDEIREQPLLHRADTVNSVQAGLFSRTRGDDEALISSEISGLWRQVSSNRYFVWT
jgi:hypothetical protein